MNRYWHPTPVFLPGKSHGLRSLVGYSALGHKDSNMTELLKTHTCMYVCAQPHVLRLFVTHGRSPLSMGFPRQEC